MMSLRLVYMIVALAACVIFLNVFLGHKAEHLQSAGTAAAEERAIKRDTETKTQTQIQTQKQTAETQSQTLTEKVNGNEGRVISMNSDINNNNNDKNNNKQIQQQQQRQQQRQPQEELQKQPQHQHQQKQKVFDLTGLNVCSAAVQHRLDEPVLSVEDIGWCKNALNPRQGGVIVGKSWGNLKSSEERNKFERLNCNSVGSGKNPTCNEAWGDSHIRNWRNNKAQHFQCGANQSQVACFKNEINDHYCSITNAKIDFAKMRSVRGDVIPSRHFDQDFISIDCDGTQKFNEFKFKHLFASSSSSQGCDQYIGGTTFVYSHDNIRNLCHTWNDVMNVWLMLWLENVASQSHSINFLTIDAMKLYNNFEDLVNEFFTPYKMHFNSIMRANDFNKKRVCFEKLVLQPLPSRGFVWDNWHQDLPCSFMGPSSLFQRWNVQMRQSFGILTPHSVKTTDAIQVLLVVRSEKKNDWGSYRTSRLFLNEKEIIRSLKAASQDGKRFTLVVQDMGQIKDFSQQIKLIADTSIVVAMHGAGLVQTMYMSVGTSNCCGVIEMFPKGEFSPVRGYANMMRKMGLHYARIDISPQDSKPDGAIVPTMLLEERLENMLIKVTKSPSCILPIIETDPYLS